MARHTMVLDDEEYILKCKDLRVAMAAVKQAEACMLRVSKRDRCAAQACAMKVANSKLRAARVTLGNARAVKNRLLAKLGHRAMVIHRQNVHAAGQKKLQDADEATLLAQTAFEEYGSMSEGEAVAFLLERCNKVDERVAKRRESNALRGTAKPMVMAACTVGCAQAEVRERRCAAWRERREAMLCGGAAPKLVEVTPPLEVQVALSPTELQVLPRLMEL